MGADKKAQIAQMGQLSETTQKTCLWVLCGTVCLGVLVPLYYRVFGKPGPNIPAGSNTNLQGKTDKPQRKTDPLTSETKPVNQPSTNPTNQQSATGNSNPAGEQQTDDKGKGFWKKWMWWIIGGVLVLALIGGILCCVQCQDRKQTQIPMHASRGGRRMY